MDPLTVIHASCEVRGVIRVLEADGHNATEIYRRLCLIYGDNIMSGTHVEGMV